MLDGIAYQLWLMIVLLSSLHVLSRHLDYVEIGTADFDALATVPEQLDITGLSVDCVKYLLDKLPTSPTRLHLHACVAEEDGEVDVYTVKPEFTVPQCNSTIHRKNNIRIPCLNWWYRAISTVARPSKILVKRMQLAGVPVSEVSEVFRVRAVTYPTLLKLHNITSLELLKIDIEGMDYVVLSQVYEYGIQTNKWPLWVQYERLPGAQSTVNSTFEDDVAKKIDQKYVCWKDQENSHYATNFKCILNHKAGLHTEGPRNEQSTMTSTLYSVQRRCCHGTDGNGTLVNPICSSKAEYFLRRIQTLHCEKLCKATPECVFFTMTDNFVCFLSQKCDVDLMHIPGAADSAFSSTFAITSRIPSYLKTPPIWTAIRDLVDFTIEPETFQKPTFFDGKKVTSASTCFISQRPYMLLDLGTPVVLDALRISMGPSVRIGNPQAQSQTTWEVFVGQSANHTEMQLCGPRGPLTFNPQLRVTKECPGAVGRYVLVNPLISVTPSSRIDLVALIFVLFLQDLITYPLLGSVFSPTPTHQSTA